MFDDFSEIEQINARKWAIEVIYKNSSVSGKPMEQICDCARIIAVFVLTGEYDEKGASYEP